MADESPRAADLQDSDRVVVAPEGRAGLKAVTPGKMAHGDAQQTTRPVLVARATKENVDRVLVAYDGSPAARRAVRFLASLAPSKKLDLLLVNMNPHFAVPAATPIAYRRAAMEAAGCINARRQRAAERCLQAAARLLSADGRRVASRVASGPAAQVLDQIAREEDIDLLVLGSDQPAASGRHLPADAAARLASHSCTSVLVVR